MCNGDVFWADMSWKDSVGRRGLGKLDKEINYVCYSVGRSGLDKLDKEKLGRREVGK